MKTSSSKKGRAEKTDCEHIARRHFTREGSDVYGMFEWVLTNATIVDGRGNIIFKRDNLKFPAGFSSSAVGVVGEKYLKRKEVPVIESEDGIGQLVRRVVDSITKYGHERGYFCDDCERDSFRDELTYLVLSQRYSFNSPIWFNAGLFSEYGIKGDKESGLHYWDPITNSVRVASYANEKPQGSACFILKVEDRLFGMDSITEWYTTEAKVFRGGSGTGVNISRMRAEGEQLSGGGKSSGSISFASVAECGSGAIKSGGKTRRAAKMVTLDSNHPDIMNFVRLKSDVERHARALAAMGYPIGEHDPNADKFPKGYQIYSLLPWQNENHTVRVDDEFMKKVGNGGEVGLVERVSGNVREKIKAEELFAEIVTSAFISGDPGLQFDTTINSWNTCSNSGRINASNPCSEYMFLDNSACNLGSLNLNRFVSGGRFDIKGFKHAVRIATLAQEIIVDYSGYPTEDIARNSHDFRALGLGYANLGGLLMDQAIPYNSDDGRLVAAAITCLMTGHAYETSSAIARRMGVFERFEENKEPMLNVIKKHRSASLRLKVNGDGKLRNLETIVNEGQRSWDRALKCGKRYGYRNAQVTVLAPTGTIGFMLDADTTGVEPVLAHIVYKNLVGGGGMWIENNRIPSALKKLGYSEREIERIGEYIREHKTIEGAPGLKEEDLAVFDCSFSAGGKRSLPIGAHIEMMGAVQPFISGAISKTVNMPKNARLEDVWKVYYKAWELGLKAITVYRDGSKLQQPLNASANSAIETFKRGEKREFPINRDSYTLERKIKVGKGVEHSIHIMVGEYEDGTPGEVRIQGFKEGSTFKAALDTIGIMISTGLKHGTPLKAVLKKLIGVQTTAFDGTTDDPIVTSCTSLDDFIGRKLAKEYLALSDYQEISGDYDYVPDPSYILRRIVNERRIQMERYRTEMDLMDRIKGLKNLKGIQDFDAREKRKDGGHGNGNGHNGNMILEPCDNCGGFLIPDGKCKKCCNCGKTVGGCSA